MLPPIPTALPFPARFPRFAGSTGSPAVVPHHLPTPHTPLHSATPARRTPRSPAPHVPRDMSISSAPGCGPAAGLGPGCGSVTSMGSERSVPPPRTAQCACPECAGTAAAPHRTAPARPGTPPLSARLCPGSHAPLRPHYAAQRHPGAALIPGTVPSVSLCRRSLLSRGQHPCGVGPSAHPDRLLKCSTMGDLSAPGSQRQPSSVCF